MGSWLGWCVAVDTEFKYVVQSPVSAIYTRAYLLIHSGKHFLTLAQLFFFSVAFFWLARHFFYWHNFFCWCDFFLLARLLFAGVSDFFSLARLFLWLNFLVF